MLERKHEGVIFEDALKRSEFLLGLILYLSSQYLVLLVDGLTDNIHPSHTYLRPGFIDRA